MPRKLNNSMWQPVTKIKKVIKCQSCGKRINIQNFNRTLCDDCGYRDGKYQEHKNERK